MNRVQFMEQLKKLLSDISEEERQEALEYYESYFDDAGEDQEAEVIRELGSPGKVAAIIKEDLKGSSQNYGEFTENGFQDERADIAALQRLPAKIFRKLSPALPYPCWESPLFTPLKR